MHSIRPQFGRIHVITGEALKDLQASQTLMRASGARFSTRCIAQDGYLACLTKDRAFSTGAETLDWVVPYQVRFIVTDTDTNDLKLSREPGQEEQFNETFQAIVRGERPETAHNGTKINYIS